MVAVGQQICAPPRLTMDSLNQQFATTGGMIMYWKSAPCEMPAPGGGGTNVRLGDLRSASAFRLAQHRYSRPQVSWDKNSRNVGRSQRHPER